MVSLTSKHIGANPVVTLRHFDYVQPMLGLTSDSTCSSFDSITGGKGPTSGQCPLDSAPTAGPRMLHKFYH